MTKEEALKQFAALGAAWFGNSKQHFAFSAYCRLQGWNKLADKWKEEAEEEWEEAEEVLNRLVELGCKPADLQEAMKTQEFPFYDDPKAAAISLSILIASGVKSVSICCFGSS